MLLVKSIDKKCLNLLVCRAVCSVLHKLLRQALMV